MGRGEENCERSEGGVERREVVRRASCEEEPDVEAIAPRMEEVSA